MVKLALVEDIPQFKLNTGATIPAVGLGTWQAEPGVVGQAVKQAIKVGYRHIDCAKAYANEKEIGDALQELQKEGIVKREELFITSKLWCTDHNPADVAKALEGSIERLQCDYLDLYLMHWPAAFKKDSQGSAPENFAPLNIKATWAAMEECYESGKAKAIGISNFTVEKIEALLSHCKVRPAVNQVECHPLWQQKKLAPYLKSEGIHLTAYSPIGSSNSPFAKINVLELPLLTKLAEKYERTPAQIALQWNVNRGHSVLPKSTHADRIASNIEFFDFKISEEDLREFEKIQQHRLLRGDDEFINDTTSPYKSVEELWDGDI
jgi:diketogulonate reductase-like aldo/keto reductase